MPGSPNYGFNRKPQFSVNHISEYLSTNSAPQRRNIIRDAKFPQKPKVAAYSQVRQPIKKALTSGDGGSADLKFLLSKLKAKELTETGWPLDEVRRCIKALESFMMLPAPLLKGESLSPAASRIHHTVEDVKIKVSLDAMITTENDGETYAGGAILLYNFSQDRTKVFSRIKHAAGLVLRALEGRQMQPLPRLCLCIDIADKQIQKASPSHQRFRANVTDSCAEVAALWDQIEPPASYDGPDWV